MADGDQSEGALKAIARTIRQGVGRFFGRGRWAHVRLAVFAVLVIAILIMASGASLRWPLGRGGGTSAPHERAPAEFLYLDSARALAYLAQMQGGMTSSKELSQRLRRSVSGKLALQGLEAGASTEEEESAQRVVTPTAASSYIELIDALEVNEDLRQLKIRCYRCVQGLHEGEFVLFRAHSMRPPAYVNPYLVVRQNATLSALFPTASTSGVTRERILAQREAAIKFAKQVGNDPRMVFALRPNGKTADATQYLLPLHYGGLTSERSLIKYGGGAFEVLGKVVRIFPEPGRKPKGHELAYVDSPTREVWQEPLRRAIPQLLCRAEPQCLKKVRGEIEPRGEAINDTEKELEAALISQTQIHRHGAVILPVAIYK